MDDSRKRALASLGKVRLIDGPPGVGKTYFGCQLAEHELNTALLSRPGKILFLTFARNAVARIRQTYLSRIADSHERSVTTKRLRQFAGRVELNTFAGFFWWLNEAYGRYVPGGKVGRPWLVGSSRTTDIPIPVGHIPFDFEHLESEALGVLRIASVRKLVSDVYPLIVVDEHQDVHASLHEMLILLSDASRLVLLHGPGQCIYGNMKQFDPAKMLELAKRTLQPDVFSLSPLGEGSRRHSRELTLLIDEYDANTTCRWDGVWTRRKLIDRINKNGNPNELETHAILLLRDLRSQLQSLTPNKRLSLALLASTNSGVIDLYHRLRTGSDSYHLQPLAGTLVLNDLLILHYGRLLLELLGVHWMSRSRAGGTPQLVAEFLGLLFAEAGVTRSSKEWLPLAGTLLQMMQRQKPPKASDLRKKKLLTDLSKVNDLLRATKAKLPTGSPSTPFTKTDIGLLTILTEEFIEAVEPFISALRGVDLSKVRCLFEAKMQQRIIFEKHGVDYGVQVMTIHKAKGREFDGVVVVLEDNRKALWLATSATPERELYDLYRVAISRPRNALGLVAFGDALTLAKPPVRRLLA